MADNLRNRKGQEEKTPLEDEDAEFDENDEFLSDTSDAPKMLNVLPNSFRLGMCAAVTVLGYFAIWIGILAWRPKVAACFGCSHASLIPLFFYWFQHRRTVKLQLLVYYYLFGFLPGAILVYFFQYLVSMFLFGVYSGLNWYSWIQRENGTDWTTTEYVILGLVAYFAFALPDELVKYFALKGYAENRHYHSRKHLMLCTGTSIGFANGQAFIIIIMVYLADNYFRDGIFLASFLLAVSNTPLHLCTGYSLALKQAGSLWGRRSGFLACVVPNIVLRGTSVYQTFLFVIKGKQLAAIPGNFAIVLLGALYTWSLWRQFPQQAKTAFKDSTPSAPSAPSVQTTRR